MTIYDKRPLFTKTPPKIKVNRKILIKIITILTIIATIGGLLKMYVVGNNLGGISIYFDRPLLVRQFIVGIQLGENQVSQLFRVGGYLANIGFLSMVFGGILFAQKGKARLLGLMPFIGLVVAQMSVMGRYKFVTGIIFFMTAFILFSYFLPEKERRIRIFEIIFYSIGSLIFILSFSYLIIKLRSPLADNIIKLVKESMYLYFTGGISALDKFLASNFHYTFGESSFRTVFKWLARIGLWPEENVYLTHNEFVKVSATFTSNTYTFVRSLYRDFGLFGVLVTTFIWGALTKISIYRAYLNFSFTNVVIACIFTFSLIITFFSFYFQGITGIAFWVIVAFIIQKIWGSKIFELEHSSQKRISEL